MNIPLLYQSTYEHGGCGRQAALSSESPAVEVFCSLTKVFLKQSAADYLSHNAIISHNNWVSAQNVTIKGEKNKKKKPKKLGI